MIESARNFLSFETGIAAVVVGVAAALVWARFASQITDAKIKRAILYCLLAIILLTSSELMFVIQSLVARGAAVPAEAIEKLELLEYMRYFLISAGFAALVLAANAELNISRTYTFVGTRFKKGRNKA